MSFTYLAILLLCLSLIYYFTFENSPIKHEISDLEDLERFFQGFIWHQEEGSLLFIKHKASDCFVQLSKFYENGETDYFHFAFPEVKWSKRYFNSVRSELKSNGFSGKIQQLNDTPPIRFYEIDFKADKKKAIKIAIISFKAMNISSKDTFIVHYEGTLKKSLYKDMYKEIKKSRPKRSKI